MENFDASAYNISIVRRPVDGHFYFVGTVREFPHIKVYEDSWTDSYSAIKAILEDLYTEAVELGEKLPEPISEDTNYSGRVTTRLPKWLHARLDAQAKDENVSLNTHVVSLLSLASVNRTYAESQAPKIKPASNQIAKRVTATFKLPLVAQNIVQHLDESITISEVRPMTVYIKGKFPSSSAVPPTETKTYRQDLRHGQETRH